MTDSLAPTPPARLEAEPDPLVLVAPGVWIRRRYLLDPAGAVAALAARSWAPSDPEAWTDLHNR